MAAAAAYEAAALYGPQVLDYVETHPQTLENIGNAVGSYQASRGKGNGGNEPSYYEPQYRPAKKSGLGFGSIIIIIIVIFIVALFLFIGSVWSINMGEQQLSQLGDSCGNCCGNCGS